MANDGDRPGTPRRMQAGCRDCLHVVGVRFFDLWAKSHREKI